MYWSLFFESFGTVLSVCVPKYEIMFYHWSLMRNQSGYSHEMAPIFTSIINIEVNLETSKLYHVS